MITALIKIDNRPYGLWKFVGVLFPRWDAEVIGSDG